MGNTAYVPPMEEETVDAVSDVIETVIETAAIVDDVDMISNIASDLVD